MAKISANGAKEMGRFRHRRSGGWFLVRSDGTVLTKGGYNGARWARAAGTRRDVTGWLRFFRGSQEYDEYSGGFHVDEHAPRDV